MSEAPAPESVPSADEHLFAVVRELAVELRKERAADLRVARASRLDRDLGFDSLSRTELLLRIERAFDVKLPDRLLAEAETVGDLLDALGRAGAAPAERSEQVAAAAGPAEAAPAEAATLLAVLDWHAERQPERPHLWVTDDGERETAFTYRALREQAVAVAAGLTAAGVAPGERIALMLPTSPDFFVAFFGILYAGAIPVPIYPPVRPSQIEEHLRRQSVILNNAEATLLVTVPEARRLAFVLRGQVPSLRAVETIERLAAETDAPPPAAAGVKGADTALIQYTSGSTGDPKGVVLTHANLLANVRAMCQALRADAASDVFVSWLPLYHDMGLIGAWLGCLYLGVPVSILSPLLFLARPERWLWEIHRRRGTLSGAPNFAYELCLRRIDDRRLQGLDLSSLRVSVNGAEPVRPETLRGFATRFAAYGLRPGAVAPVYGLAECSVGLAFPPPGREVPIDRVDRRALTERDRAVPAAADDANALEVVACGLPLPGHQFRVVDGTGREVPERTQGRLQFRGPSATSGYFRNPERTAALFDGDWLETGDLAYTVRGDLYLTGRVKDLIIRGGRNIYPQEIEVAVNEVAGVRRGCVVAFGAPDPDSGTDRLVVVAETRAADDAARAAMRRDIDERVAAILGAPPDEIVLAPPHAVLKTSSGKLRRAATRELFLTGELGARRRPLWQQALRLGFVGLRGEAARGWRWTAAHLYAAWWWVCIVAAGAVAWPLALVLPTRRLRWAAVRAAGRAFFFAAGLPLDRRCAAPPPDGAVVVANHASWLDGLVVALAVPGDLAFVAKAEFATHRFIGPFLRRLGVVFVERFDAERSVGAADAAARALQAGRRVAVFPEGTMTRYPGLLPFRLGAFQLAAAAGAPVVPVALSGTRAALRGDGWFPRRTAIVATVGAPLAPAGTDFKAAVELRDRARAAMLAALGEPDLSEDVDAFLSRRGQG